MNALFEKMTEVESEISQEVGGIVLFGLFKPADAPQRWDVVVSADWVGPETTPAVAYVARKLQSRLDSEQLVSLSRVVALPPSEEFVQSVLRSVRVDHEGREVHGALFNGILMREAYIVTANPDNKPHSELPPQTTTVRGKERIRAT